MSKLTKSHVFFKRCRAILLTLIMFWAFFGIAQTVLALSGIVEIKLVYTILSLLQPLAAGFMFMVYLSTVQIEMDAMVEEDRIWDFKRVRNSMSKVYITLFFIFTAVNFATSLIYIILAVMHYDNIFMWIVFSLFIIMRVFTEVWFCTFTAITLSRRKEFIELTGIELYGDDDDKGDNNEN